LGRPDHLSCLADYTTSSPANTNKRAARVKNDHVAKVKRGRVTDLVPPVGESDGPRAGVGKDNTGRCHPCGIVSFGAAQDTPSCTVHAIRPSALRNQRRVRGSALSPFLKGPGQTPTVFRVEITDRVGTGSSALKRLGKRFAVGHGLFNSDGPAGFGQPGPAGAVPASVCSARSVWTVLQILPQTHRAGVLRGCQLRQQHAARGRAYRPSGQNNVGDGCRQCL